jgi:hypothetical protein
MDLNTRQKWLGSAQWSSLETATRSLTTRAEIRRPLGSHLWMAKLSAEIRRSRHQHEGSEGGTEQHHAHPRGNRAIAPGPEQTHSGNYTQNENTCGRLIRGLLMPLNQHLVHPVGSFQRIECKIAGVLDPDGNKAERNEAPEAEPLDFLASVNPADEEQKKQEDSAKHRNVIERQMKVNPVHASGWSKRGWQRKSVILCF